MRWGEHLEFVAEAGPGDFIYVPPFVPHQEINASKTEVLSCVVVRSGQDPIVVNLDIEPAEPPEEVIGSILFTRIRESDKDKSVRNHFAARGRTDTSFPALPQLDQADLKK